MRITLLRVAAYKGARNVTIKPPADLYVLLLAGENGAGKTSTFDAMRAALGGAKEIAKVPVTSGEEHADIYIELDDGKLAVHRTIEPDGETQLVVSDEDGPVRRPQETLDRLIGARFLDPLKFIRLDAAEQRAALMKVIPGAAEIQQLDERSERAFRQRTDVGRQLKMARGELQRLPPAAEPLKPIDVGALVTESATFAHQQRADDGLGNSVAELAARARGAKAEVQAAENQIADLERRLGEARELRDARLAAAAQVAGEFAAAQARLEASAAAWRDNTARREEVERQLRSAGDHNRQVGERDAANRRRAETAASVDRLQREVDKLTTTIDGIDKRKGEILGAAQLPVAGLAIAGDGITIRGVPFAQSAAHEQMQVALSLAIAASPGLDDVWIRDGSLLGDDTLELIAKRAQEQGKRVWIERVGTKDAGAIVIVDGQIAGST